MIKKTIGISQLRRARVSAVLAAGDCAYRPHHMNLQLVFNSASPLFKGSTPHTTEFFILYNYYSLIKSTNLK